MEPCVLKRYVTNRFNSRISTNVYQRYRLIMRPVTGIIIILLPLAHHLDATAILSIIMALFVFCTIWESVTSLKGGAHFWEPWTDTDYPDDCHKNGTTKDETTKESEVAIA